MPASGLLAALGTAFGGATAATSIVGSIAAGIGSAMMSRAELKARERRERKADERREARYYGAGDATRFGSGDMGETGTASIATEMTRQRIEPHKSPETPLGQRENTGMGAPAPSTPTAENRQRRYRYDPGKAKIVYS